MPSPNAFARSGMSKNDMYKEKLSREMTHRPFQPPPDIETAKEMIDMFAQEAFGPYGMYRAGEDMMNSLGEGDLGWAALSGLGLLPGIPAVTAWHGSGAIFPPTEKNPLGEFDDAMIGTGEGAQAYGHGHYMAENPSVGREYQRSLSDWAPEGEQLVPGSIPDRAAAFMAGAMDAQPSNPFAFARKNVRALGEKDADAIVKQIEDWWDKGTNFKRGALYKVDLPDDQVAKMLDWDAPLSEQPEAVRKAIEKHDQDVLKNYKPVDVPGWGAGKPRVLGEGNPTGAQLYSRLSGNPKNAQPFGADDQGIAAQASDFLKGIGIPGLKYLDQGSRATSGGEVLGTFKQGGKWVAKIRVKNRGGAGFADPTDQFTTSMPFKTEKEALDWARSKVDQGTRNFVVFDPAIAKILGRE